MRHISETLREMFERRCKCGAKFRSLGQLNRHDEECRQMRRLRCGLPAAPGNGENGNLYKSGTANA